MKAVIQRVFNASVSVEGEIVGKIGKGLLVLVGIDRFDEPPDRSAMIKNILKAKLFDDEQGNLWQRSVVEIQGEVLCVSQFTLFAQFKGAKPDFRIAMSPGPGKEFYQTFLEELGQAYTPDRIQNGRFGAMMQVSLTNDGPTTILLDTKQTRTSSLPTSTTPSGTVTPTTTGISSGEAAERAKEEAKAERVAANQANLEAKARKLAGLKAEGKGKGGWKGEGKGKGKFTRE